MFDQVRCSHSPRALSPPVTSSPPQFSTTHPALATVLPGLGTHSRIGPPSLPPSIPLAPPVAAYSGRRPHDEGGVYEQRGAAIERHRVPSGPASTRALNAPRSRNTVVTSPAPTSSHPASGSMAALHPQHVPGSSSGEASTSSQAGSAHEVFAVCLFPFVVSVFRPSPLALTC